MLVVCVGMRRAASTSQYLIAKEIICNILGGKDFGYSENESELYEVMSIYSRNGHAVIKTHYYYPFFSDDQLVNENIKFLGTYRDMREVAVSIMRANNSSFDKVVVDKLIEQEIGKFYQYRQLKYVLMQDYRLFGGDMSKAVTDISKFLEVDLSEEQIQDINEKCCADSLKEKVNGYKTTFRFKTITLINTLFVKLNPTSMMPNGLITNRDKKNDLHYNHFSKTPTNWRSQLSEEEKVVLKGITSDWLIDVGLEKDDKW